MKRSQFEAAKELYDSIDKTEREIKALEDFTSEIKVSAKAGGTIEIQIFNPRRVANTRVNVRSDVLEDLIKDEIKTMKAQKKDMADKLCEISGFVGLTDAERPPKEPEGKVNELL